jgi:hypothetical protein
MKKASWLMHDDIMLVSFFYDYNEGEDLLYVELLSVEIDIKGGQAPDILPMLNDAQKESIVADVNYYWDDILYDIKNEL